DGTDAMVAALEKMSRMSVWEQALHTLRYNRIAGVSFFDQYRKRFLERPSSEADRVHEREMQRGFRLDATHPPNVFRIEFLGAHRHAGRVSLTPERSSAIDRELEPFEDRIEQHLLDSFGYRAGLTPAGP